MYGPNRPVLTRYIKNLQLDFARFQEKDLNSILVFRLLWKLIRITHFFSEIYRQGVHIFPENPELCTSLGLLYLQTGAHAAAFEQLGNAMAFDPNNSKAVLAAGSVGKLYSLAQSAISNVYHNHFHFHSHNSLSKTGWHKISQWPEWLWVWEWYEKIGDWAFKRIFSQ